MKLASKAFGPTALTADTKTQIGSDYNIPKGGTVRSIRFCAYNGVIDKASTGKLIMESDLQKGPFEWAVDIGGTWATTSGASPTFVNIIIPEGISFQAGEIIQFYGTAAEALEEATVSVEWT